MSNNPISQFQTVDWQIINFDYVRGLLTIPADIPHQWKLHTHIERLDAEEKTLHAVVDIRFEMKAEAEGGNISLSGQCLTGCILDTEGIENADELFDRLIKSSAMVNSLANLRVFLMQQGALLQMGQKRVMLPFINLNHYHFDEDVVMTV